MTARRRPRLRALTLGCSVLALAACQDFDLDLRSNGANTSDAVRQQTAPRPAPDARGVISYPNYQVAVARRGDSVADVAARVGLPAGELATFNGLPQDVALREGELLALPASARETAPDDTIDITTLAGGAIERADGAITPATTTTPATATQAEPIRHRVERGETAYSIARLYNVSVRSLADWNGLAPDLSVREGQYLLIPVVTTTAAPATPETTTPPGAISRIPVPPTAARPLPDEPTAPAAAPVTPPPSPDLEEEKTVTARLAFPVEGQIFRGYEKKKNDGIDISAPAGSPIKAAEAGTVAAITRDTDQVPILVLRHSDNLLTVYANIADISVAKGDTVKRGQQVATVRASDPAFLHFEVREGFESVDPMSYLN
ncbi:MAG: peptidoglycan DD-metalloendopeptidase family protein [Pseudomonadota bacterium]|nr:peptidoglycan DD-metalloendopeptidase family protein [Pseudomonadota bacterium]